MRDYTIFFAFYPFNMENLEPEKETINANSLEDAFKSMEDRYGDRIEIFKEPARKFYKE